MTKQAASEPAGATTTIVVQPARYVRISLASYMTGLTVKAIEKKIENGKWAEGKQYVRKDGEIYVDIQGFEKWVVAGIGGR